MRAQTRWLIPRPRARAAAKCTIYAASVATSAPACSARASASARNALTAGGWRRLARQTSDTGHVMGSGRNGRITMGGPSCSATDRGSTATPSPCDASARTALISVQMNPIRGSRPWRPRVASRRRRSAELSRCVIRSSDASCSNVICGFDAIGWSTDATNTNSSSHRRVAAKSSPIPSGSTEAKAQSSSSSRTIASIASCVSSTMCTATPGCWARKSASTANRSYGPTGHVPPMRIVPRSRPVSSSSWLWKSSISASTRCAWASTSLPSSVTSTERLRSQRSISHRTHQRGGGTAPPRPPGEQPPHPRPAGEPAEVARDRDAGRREGEEQVGDRPGGHQQEEQEAPLAPRHHESRPRETEDRARRADGERVGREDEHEQAPDHERAEVDEHEPRDADGVAEQQAEEEQPDHVREEVLPADVKEAAREQAPPLALVLDRRGEHAAVADLEARRRVRQRSGAGRGHEERDQVDGRDEGDRDQRRLEVLPAHSRDVRRVRPPRSRPLLLGAGRRASGRTCAGANPGSLRWRAERPSRRPPSYPAGSWMRGSVSRG